MTESGNPLIAPPRPATARVRSRAWSEPRIRFWLLAAIALGLVGMSFIGSSLIARAHQTALIAHGIPIQARVTVANGETVKNRPQPPDSLVYIEFPWKGQTHTPPPQTLEGRKEFIVTNSTLPIHVNPQNPDEWTWLDAPLPLLAQNIGAMVSLPLAATAFLFAMLRRKGMLQLWKEGKEVEALVLETRSIAVAPHCRAVRVTPDQYGDDRVYTVYVPPSLAKLSRGDRLPIIREERNSTFALSTAWFE